MCCFLYFFSFLHLFFHFSISFWLLNLIHFAFDSNVFFHQNCVTSWWQPMLVYFISSFFVLIFFSWSILPFVPNFHHYVVSFGFFLTFDWFFLIYVIFSSQFSKLRCFILFYISFFFFWSPFFAFSFKYFKKEIIISI